MTLKKIKDNSFRRLLNMLSNQTFAIITAYRHKDADGKALSQRQNTQRNSDLRAKLTKRKMGVYILEGHWQEAPDGVNEKTTINSYVVQKQKDLSDKEFIKFMRECMTVNGFTQNACILHTDRYYLLLPDNSMIDLGENLSLDEINQVYSQRVLARDLPFVFDSVARPQNSISFLAFSKLGLSYLRESF